MLKGFFKVFVLVLLFHSQGIAQENPLYDTTEWKDISEYIPSAVLNIRYASVNNFTEKKIYDCAACYMRTKAAIALKKVAEELAESGHCLIIYDCYRPSPYQYRLWESYPNASYVAPPQKGSVHSRGLAIDLSIVNKDGYELDMGTDHDFFGREAHQDFYDLPEGVLKNRALLKGIMEKYGFSAIRTEWWHYNYGDGGALEDALWDCD